MAHPQYNQYQQNMHNMPPLQTQNQMQSQRAFSPPNYQQSPGAMSPTAGGIPPAKRQRLSPQPASPYNSPFSAGPYVTSPYATSPPGNQYLSLPHSPAMSQPPTPSFNQPQPYHHLQNMESRPPLQGSMPPPKVPYSKTQDNAELEKANPRDMDVNNISDVMTGAGVDLRAEEDALLSNIGSRSYGASFNSQATGSTVSPQGSFNQWPNQAGHGAYQGSGPLSQPTTKGSQEDELLEKHRKAARILNETGSQPLTDPFLVAGALRQRLAKRAYEHGISVNLEGLFDKIPENTPSNVTRTTIAGSNGESVVGLQASSLLNQNAPLVEILSLLSLAAEERVRTVVEDSFALSQGRKATSDGIVPPSMADIAAIEGKTATTTVVPVNISKTAWEAAPDSAISPMTVTAQKQPPNAARLPTPPSEAPPTPQSTIQFTTNHVMDGLKRKITEDEQYEQERIKKRKKREQGSSATPAETPTLAPLPMPEKMTKKERDRLNKAGQTEEVLHRKTNETTNLALFGKKKSKYSWMSAGGASSGASTPRLNTAVGGSSGTATPMRPQTDGSLKANRHLWLGGGLESAQGQSIQIRDLVHVLEHDGRERKTLVSILARLRSSIKDDQKVEDRPKTVAPAR